MRQDAKMACHIVAELWLFDVVLEILSIFVP